MSPAHVESGSTREWSRAVQYALAVGAVAAALLVRWLLNPVLGAQTPFITVFSVMLPLVLLVRPGPFIAATAIAFFGTWYLIIPRQHSFVLEGDGAVLQVELFAIAVTAATVTTVLASRRRERERQTHLRLRQHEQEFRAMFESSSVGKVQTDLDGRLLRVNQAFCDLLGRHAADLLGRPLLDLAHEDERSANQAEFGRFVRGEAACFRVEARYLHKDGSIVWGLTTANLVRDADGRAVRVITVVQDVTQRRQAEQALREADRRKDDFLATLSHELRNPLASTMNAVEMLDRFGGKDDIAVKARAILRRQATHMVRLIDDLLDLGRIARGKPVLRRRHLELVGLVRRVAQDHAPLHEARRQVLRLSLPPAGAQQPMWIDADPTRVEQVIGNLLTNARKYTPAGGNVALTLAREGAVAVVTVSDDGIGIAPHDLPRLFEPFAQLHEDPNLGRGGIGIGLALVKQLVELHGGSVEAHSAGRGMGSTFRLRLPLVEAPTSPAGEAAPSADQSAAAAETDFPAPEGRPSARRILVVDDNRDAAESLARLLALGGDDLQTAHDGPEAIAAAERFNPDLVLLDIGLPSMNGYDVCRHIRARLAGRRPVMVALTGWGQEEDRRKSAEAGFDHHLVKPVQFHELTALLDGARLATSGRSPGSSESASTD